MYDIFKSNIQDQLILYQTLSRQVLNYKDHSVVKNNFTIIVVFFHFSTFVQRETTGISCETINSEL